MQAGYSSLEVLKSSIKCAQSLCSSVYSDPVQDEAMCHMLNIKWTEQVTWFLFNSFNLLTRYKIGLSQELFLNVKG